MRASTMAYFRNAAACAKMTVGDRPPEYRLRSSHQLFQEILCMFHRSLAELHDLGLVRGEASTYVLIATLYRPPVWAGHLQAFDDVLDNLRSAETFFLQARDNFKAFQGWEAIQKVRLSAKEFDANILFPLAISVVLAIPDPMERSRKIWTWIQKSKAQGLVRLLELELATEGAKVGAQEKGQNSAKRRLREIEAEATQSELDQLEALSSAANSEVVFVNWYSHPSAPHLQDIILAAVFRPGKSIKAFPLKISLSEVNHLANKLFSGDEQELKKSDIEREFQKLVPLVEPLKRLSNPGDTLVFLPSGLMHRIPLHALKLDDEILIRRNAIVYSSSTAVLLHAFHTRRSYERQIDNGIRNWQAAVFGDPSLEAGKPAILSVAEAFDVSPHLTSETFTRGAFTRSIRHTSLFHYHGHANFQEDQPLEHFLKFSDADVTMRDIFDLHPVATSYHATLLGCGSSMSRISSSNEIFGLVPAFEYAGAASTISTLWKIDDVDAATFSKEFYAAFSSTPDLDVSAGYVDLAKALQRATLLLMDERPALYHWAPFVLNGWWIYRPQHTVRAES